MATTTPSVVRQPARHLLQRLAAAPPRLRPPRRLRPVAHRHGRVRADEGARHASRRRRRRRRSGRQPAAASGPAHHRCRPAAGAAAPPPRSTAAAAAAAGGDASGGDVAAAPACSRAVTAIVRCPATRTPRRASPSRATTAARRAAASTPRDPRVLPRARREGLPADPRRARRRQPLRHARRRSSNTVAGPGRVLQPALPVLRPPASRSTSTTASGSNTNELLGEGRDRGRGRRRDRRTAMGVVRRHLRHVRAVRRRACAAAASSAFGDAVPVPRSGTTSAARARGASPSTAPRSPSSPPSSPPSASPAATPTSPAASSRASPATSPPSPRTTRGTRSPSKLARARYERDLRSAGGAELPVPARPRHDVEPGGQPHPPLKADGVTTVICGCDPIFPVFLSGVAARENYFPEFIIAGTALTDADIVGQLWNQEFASHAFGVSPLQELRAADADDRLRRRSSRCARTRSRRSPSTSSTTRCTCWRSASRWPGRTSRPRRSRRACSPTRRRSDRSGCGTSGPATTPPPTTSARSTGTRTRSRATTAEPGAYVGVNRGAALPARPAARSGPFPRPQ